MKVYINKDGTVGSIDNKKVSSKIFNEYNNSSTKIVVDIPTNNYTLVLVPSDDHIIGDGIVVWGDGSKSDLSLNHTHTYAKAGKYEIEGHFIFGLGVKPTVSMQQTLIKVLNLSKDHTSLAQAFATCRRLLSFRCTNTLKVGSLKAMFSNCDSLQYVKNIDNFNTRSVVDFSEMFNNCKALKSIEGLETLDAISCTYANNMFYNCKQLEYKDGLDLSGWNNMQNLVNTSNMFHGCEKLHTINLTGWFLNARASNMDSMFMNCFSLQKIIGMENWNVSGVRTMIRLFYYCKNITDLNNIHYWDVSKVTDMSYLFAECSSIEEIDLQGWNTSSLITMEAMFSRTPNLKEIKGLTSLNVSKVTVMNNLFNSTGMSEISVEGWNATRLNKAEYMFAFCPNLVTVNVTNFNTPDIISAKSMFDQCTLLTSIIGIETMTFSTLYTGSYMFNYCESLTSLDLSNWGIAALNAADCMFYGSGLVNINVSGWSTRFVNDFSYMFANCYDLVTITGLDDFILTNANTLHSMFSKCYALTSLTDVQNWNVEKVTDLSLMFNACNSITELDLSNWDVSNVTTMASLFYKCYDLVELNLSMWDIANVTDLSNMFGKCESLEELYIDGWLLNTSALTDYMFDDINTDFIWIYTTLISDAYTLNTIFTRLPEIPSDGSGTIGFDYFGDDLDMDSVIDKGWRLYPIY